MKFVVILFVIFVCESIATPLNDMSQCFKVEKNGVRFQFSCFAQESEEFDFNDWIAMTNLKEIDIQKSNLKKVKNLALLEYVDLTKFNAEWNHIENAREIIQNLNPSTEQLFLSGNPIGEVKAEIFKKLINLKALHLSHTNLKIIDSSPFDQLKSLERLDISGNDLSDAKVPILSTKLENLKVFDATDCRIQNASELIKMFPPSIQSIRLAGNSLENLTDDLKISNPFKEMRELRQLYLSNTNFTIGDSNPFESLEYLEELDISHNDLSNVNFTILWLTLGKLEHFSAAGSKVKNAFNILNLLWHPITLLDLSDNFIGEIQFNIFNKFRRLTKLNLRNTSLQLVGTEVIHNHLLDLDISYNKLGGFNFAILAPILQSLRHFKAAGCGIRNVDVVLKHIEWNIEELDLSGNPIEQLNFNQFTTFLKLERLHLSDSNLTSFNFSSLEHKEHFKILNISFNHLTQLNISTTILNLETLDVRGNQLQKIHNFDRQHLPKLRTLGISGNRFTCEYLQQIKNEWAGLEIIDDEWNQKDNKCD